MYFEDIFIYPADVLTCHTAVLMCLSDVPGAKRDLLFKMCFKTIQAIDYIQSNYYFDFI